MRNDKRKKILIIGGTGFLGYHLSKACLRTAEITSLSLSKPRKIRKLKFNSERVKIKGVV